MLGHSCLRSGLEAEFHHLSGYGVLATRNGQTQAITLCGMSAGDSQIGGNPFRHRLETHFGAVSKEASFGQETERNVIYFRIYHNSIDGTILVALNKTFCINFVTKTAKSKANFFLRCRY